jgi:hypothetical protein
MKKLLLSLVLVFAFLSSSFAECISGDCDNGYGIYLWDGGDKYDGDWKNGEMYGHGAYYFGDSGNRYAGEVKNGFRDGLGKFTWADGDQYIGEFKANQMSGYGMYIYSDGTIESGIWKNDELIESN